MVGRVNPVRNTKVTRKKNKISIEVKTRRLWKINPKTKIIESKKRYGREKIKRELERLIEDAEKEILKSGSAQRKSPRKDI